MGRFGPKDRAEFLAIKAACYRGLGSSHLLAYLGGRLGNYCQAEGTCMVLLDPGTVLPTYAVSQGWLEEAHRLVVEHALLGTPTADPPMLAAQGRRTVVTEALVPLDRPYYRDPYFEYHILWGGYLCWLLGASELVRSHSPGSSGVMMERLTAIRETIVSPLHPGPAGVSCVSAACSVAGCAK